jgi:hypothetical protein
MRIKQISGQLLLSEFARRRLEAIYFSSLDSARFLVQREFPNHVVRRDQDRLVVSVKDCSFDLAVFTVSGDRHEL